MPFKKMHLYDFFSYLPFVVPSMTKNGIGLTAEKQLREQLERLGQLCAAK